MPVITENRNANMNVVTVNFIQQLLEGSGLRKCRQTQQNSWRWVGRGGFESPTVSADSSIPRLTFSKISQGSFSPGALRLQPSSIASRFPVPCALCRGALDPLPAWNQMRKA